MIKTQGLTHIHLVVRDLERSLRFYQGVFGMEERFRDGPKMVFLNTPGSPDLITLNDVLEHVRRPDLALQKLYGLVRPGGVLLVTTIDRDSAPALILGRR